MISHTGIPSPACVPEMPSRPISLAVSKLSPNKKPSGSMCQSLVTRRKRGLNNRVSSPAVFSAVSLSCGANSRSPGTRRKVLQTSARMVRFIPATTNRNRVETEVRTIAPTSFQGAKREPKREGNVLDAAAIANAARNKMRADACRTLTLLHELAGDVVDGGDVIGIDGVAQT